MGSKFATVVAKQYGECPEMLVVLRKMDRETVWIVKGYGGSKVPRMQAP